MKMKVFAVMAVAMSAVMLAGAGGTGASAVPRAGLVHPAVSAAATQGWHSMLKVPNAQLVSLAALPHNAWAAGYQVSGASLRSLLEHFDGRAWHPVSLPAQLDPSAGGIDEVAASSPRNLWIFITHAGQPLAGRWDGRRWHVETPPAGRDQLDRAAITFGPQDTWDFGNSLVAHFTASGWQVRPFGLTATGISAVSSSDMWAYGFGASISAPTIAAYWNGQHWTYQPVPLSLNPTGYPRLTPGGIHAFGPSDVWVVGDAWTPALPAVGVPMVLHWDGHAWRRAYTGHAGQLASLDLITADGSGDLWMASRFGPGLLHEHNGRYTPVPGPTLPLPHDAFLAHDLTWLPGTRTLLLTGYLASETREQYGHVESYTY
jgi:hypothetical protein